MRGKTKRQHLETGGLTLLGKDGNQYPFRMIRSSDVDLVMAGYDALPERSKWFRMLYALPHLTPEMAKELCSPDPHTSACAVIEGIGNLSDQLIGGARILEIGSGQTAEFAIMLRPEAQGLGLAHQALSFLLSIAKEEGCRSVWGEVAGSNSDMLRLARCLGFEVRTDPDDFSLRQVELAFSRS